MTTAPMSGLAEEGEKIKVEWTWTTGWHFRLFLTSRWHQNKISVLVKGYHSGCAKPQTSVMVSTGGLTQPDVSPCSQTAQARPRTHADTSAPMIRRLCYVLAQGDPSGCCPDFFWHQIENWFLESWHTVLSQFIKTQPLSEQNLMNNLMNHPNMPIKGSPNLSNWNRAWWVN